MRSKRYSLSNLQKALDNPSLFIDEAKRIINKGSATSINKYLNKKLYKQEYNNQFDVMTADWDNLIILDGFRYDYFEKYCEIEGDLSSIISQGSHSSEFQRNTFVGKQFHDTVYITSNPHSPRLIDNGVFYFTKSVYSENHSSKPREHYPDRVMEMALRIMEQHPNKRYIIHMMQPNVPFLGPTAEQVRKRLYEERDIIFVGMEPPDLPPSFTPKEEIGELKEACEKGYISKETLREAYTENVKIALDYAEELLQEIQGKTAITADHGEMLGEPLAPLNFEQYSHESYLYTDELRVVPWLVINSGERREVSVDDPIKDDYVSEDIIKDRLKQLGYLDYV